MAQASKEPLRLFSTFDSPKRQAGASAATGAPAATAAAKQEAAFVARWGPLFKALTSQLDQPTTALLLQCVAHGYSAAGQPPVSNFSDGGSKAPLAAGGDGGSGSDGALAAAFAERLLPGWWFATRCVPLWRWQATALLESPCFGVPGICRYTAARAAWLRQQIHAAIDAEGCTQVVLLGTGLSTWSHSLARAGIKFFEVDSRAALHRRKALLDATLPPYWRSAALRPRFVEVDLASPASLKLLACELTAAGFDPAARACFVAEGLLPFLGNDALAALMSDVSALAAPGSRLLFDFLHADALDSLASANGSAAGGEAAAPLPGLANYAAAAANKGRQLRSGLNPSFSAMVRWLQPNHWRPVALLAPRDVARLSLGQPAAAGGGGSGAAAAPGALPYVPEFLSFASAVKQDSRLLLRHADASLEEAAAAADEARLAAAAACTPLSSPSCFIRSLAFLFCGASGAAAAPAASAASDAAPTAPPSAAPAGMPAELLPPPPAAQLPPVSSHGEPQLLRAHPGSWKLSAGVVPGSARSSRSASRSSSVGSVGGGPAAGGAGLAHAESVAARLPLSTSSSSKSVCRSSNSSETFEQLMADAGHLLAGGGSAGGKAEEAAADDAYWWQFF